MPEIKIKPFANYHGRFLLVAGIALLCISIALSHHYWHALRLVLILVILVSIVLIFIGIAKRLEPEFSFHLTPTALSYFHKYGHWQISWQNIQRVGNVKLSSSVNHQVLPYIGIKLKNSEVLAKNISLRLANRLPHEQRPLATLAISSELLTIEQAQVNFAPYRLSDGSKLNGPKALLFHHIDALEKAFGYHLFLPASSLDRPLDDFLTLLNQCNSHAIKKGTDA
ncbi:DUF2982 domain-containing protein [Thalassotalea sp. M1531]|uniref:DUF2982 domain-containing protein n=1 Tax=Thalassotalea algicola TaxID=2716224 RepID=A0A7Y0Q7Z9_9GAMM|nr:DUF2982 domain-containing protein [Thalassotalea algicola]NMP31565.1 DUF2982 domain-containing protein [Thalassotalea algicola]